MGSLPSRARAVVIGAGIVGNSVAFHLARLGWKPEGLAHGLWMCRGDPGAQRITHGAEAPPIEHLVGPADDDAGAAPRGRMIRRPAELDTRWMLVASATSAGIFRRILCRVFGMLGSPAGC